MFVCIPTTYLLLYLEEQACEAEIFMVGQVFNPVANTSIRTEPSSSYVLFRIFTLPSVDIKVTIRLYAQSFGIIWSVLLFKAHCFGEEEDKMMSYS